MRNVVEDDDLLEFRTHRITLRVIYHLAHHYLFQQYVAFDNFSKFCFSFSYF